MLKGEPVAGLIGAAIRRTEGLPYITGKSRYVDDITPPNCYYLGLVRSTQAHARITSVDISALQDAPGIFAVLTGSEMRDLCRPIYNWCPLKWLKTVDTYPLAIDKVRFVGEPIVAIVCRSRETAKDAVELVNIEYEPLPTIIDAEKALQLDAPILYEEWSDNKMLSYSFKAGDPDAVFKNAELVIEEKISCHRHSPVPLEPNTYLATYDQDSGLTLWATTQHPHVLRTIISETLGVAETSIRVIQPDVGGGFGGKSPVHAEEILVSFLAMHVKGSVKYTEERTEHLRASHQAREQTHYVKVAVSKGGQVLALKDRIVANLGVYYPTSGPNSVVNVSRFVPGCYKVEHYECEVEGAATNKPPYGAYRGFGKDAASYVIERLMDKIAAELGLDPVDVRLRNIIRKEEFPYRSVTGAIYDDSDYEACLKKLLKTIDYESLRGEQRNLRAKGKYLGIGISLVLEPASSHAPTTLFIGYDGSTARLEPSGEIKILTGVTSTGTGTKTVFAQIAADELGVPLDYIKVIQGDSERCPYGYGMWASRGIVVGGNSVLLASRALKEKILRIAANLLHTDTRDLTISSGVIENRRYPSLKLSLKEIASAFYRCTVPLPRELIESGLDSTVYYFPPTVESTIDKDGKRNAYATYGSSACVAIIRVDLETGMIDFLKYVFVGDSGRIINPIILEGQIHGGVVQGIGGTIYEHNLYDEDGQPLATSFLDYLIPSALESPTIEVRHVETVSSSTLLGAKGAGEGPVEGAYGTITNAVEDALRPLGVRINDLPLTPERLWQNIRDAESKSTR